MGRLRWSAAGGGGVRVGVGVAAVGGPCKLCESSGRLEEEGGTLPLRPRSLIDKPPGGRVDQIVVPIGSDTQSPEACAEPTVLGDVVAALCLATWSAALPWALGCLLSEHRVGLITLVTPPGGLVVGSRCHTRLESLEAEWVSRRVAPTVLQGVVLDLWCPCGLSALLVPPGVVPLS